MNRTNRALTANSAVADNRVLHRVRQREQHDQVERVQLRQFAFAGQPQADDQKDIDQNRPDDFFQNRQIDDKNVIPHRFSKHGAASVVSCS